MRYDKRSALALFLCGVISAALAVTVAIQDGRGSNTAFLEAAAFFFCAAWIVERFQGRNKQ
ncbi:hypothetical protein [Streptomyces sp. NBC_00347]|uniref:hypothetical protein n=1 Tax=Streptomyces sp. NBC_00347 TaxID=2975721 RepID=UPI002251D5E0|nr:hypothetical protein [Streptomyces sp. NBC_00347]MCX5124629.1 hypothetical protein [Streptomyces sp. NBC_00347]